MFVDMHVVLLVFELECRRSTKTNSFAGTGVFFSHLMSLSRFQTSGLELAYVDSV
jgi:hypothetical protein